MGPKTSLALGALATTALILVSCSTLRAQAPQSTSQRDQDDWPEELKQSKSRLSNAPSFIRDIPTRPGLFIEWPEPFLGKGELGRGIELPGDAVWRPTLWVFGTLRTAYQNVTRPGPPGQPTNRVNEWATRLDLFAQLNFSGTERVLFGIRPLDEELPAGRRFTGYDFREHETFEGYNGDVHSLFFEGDIGEMFPFLDSDDSSRLDYGFSVGRQPVLIQDGLLINENSMDAVTLTRNTLSGLGILNMRLTGMYAWNAINRHSNTDDPEAELFGLFTETDLRATTLNIDGVYVRGESGTGSGFHGAVSANQRLHVFGQTLNSLFHVATSIASGTETPESTDGALLFAQTSLTPHGGHNLFYLSGFFAIDRFTSAARSPGTGGPLGRTGLLFAGAGLGRYGAPLDNQAEDVYGGSFGYQMFFDDYRKQLILEAGGRRTTSAHPLDEAGEVGFAARYQQAIWKNYIALVEGFGAYYEDRDWGYGGRVEFQMKF